MYTQERKNNIIELSNIIIVVLSYIMLIFYRNFGIILIFFNFFAVYFSQVCIFIVLYILHIVIFVGLFIVNVIKFHRFEYDYNIRCQWEILFVWKMLQISLKHFSFIS